ncbi:LapA family protein [Inhella gelatinilytica]|uniref:LapA family protein n=1 Tax=Inhella gelatinilytica TaxID=2795030 RepID=A0A931IWD9_9BURK|nr:LapA family protein [Inhella gelatinilytica]MBH9553374.1 LapA family protein [Inhella gelatinilytica]
MKFLRRLFYLFVFFALFAFSLNNKKDVTVHWFFGYEWTTPLVFVVLASFAAGIALGVMAMVPAWWRQRAQARRQSALPDAAPSNLAAPTVQGIRDGL